MGCTRKARGRQFKILHINHYRYCFLFYVCFPIYVDNVGLVCKIVICCSLFLILEDMFQYFASNFFSVHEYELVFVYIGLYCVSYCPDKLDYMTFIINVNFIVVSVTLLPFYDCFKCSNIANHL